MPLEFIQDYLTKLDATIRALPHEQIAGIIQAVRDARDRDAQVFVVGNGGSASTASHVAVDLGKGASNGADRRFRVHSLTDNVPWISALANDFCYEDIFVEQLKNFARPGDLLLAFSGSGNSENVLRAVRYANSIGCRTIGFAGFGGGKLRTEAQDCLVVDADHMGRVEDAHHIAQHLVVYYLMTHPYGRTTPADATPATASR